MLAVLVAKFQQCRERERGGGKKKTCLDYISDDDVHKLYPMERTYIE